MRIAAVVLAAGASSRLGSPKQLALLGGETLLARAIRAAVEAGCEPVVAVLGAEAELVREQCRLRSVRIVVNDGWAEGMASSIRLGVEAVCGQVDAAIVMTCDQPAVSSEHLRRLAARDGGQITASAYGGRRGVPAYFPAEYFPELMRLRGDQGARELVAAAEAIELPLGELDVDTPERLAAAKRIYE